MLWQVLRQRQARPRDRRQSPRPGAVHRAVAVYRRGIVDIVSAVVADLSDHMAVQVKAEAARAVDGAGGGIPRSAENRASSH